VAEININPAWYRVIISLDGFDSRQCGDTVRERDTCLEATGDVTLAADASWELEASCLSACSFHGPVPVWKRHIFVEYVPICFDVK
jgi:hypothetical protein